MPRFHFHIVEDGRVITDEEGQELTENEAVRREAETGAQSPGMHSLRKRELSYR